MITLITIILILYNLLAYSCYTYKCCNNRDIKEGYCCSRRNDGIDTFGMVLFGTELLILVIGITLVLMIMCVKYLP